MNSKLVLPTRHHVTYRLYVSLARRQPCPHKLNEKKLNKLDSELDKLNIRVI